MSELKATLIDVGWGDSIFLETDDGSGNRLYALIDSNDTSTLRSFISLSVAIWIRSIFRMGRRYRRPQKNARLSGYC